MVAIGIAVTPDCASTCAREAVEVAVELAMSDGTLGRGVKADSQGS